jgi:hypothetical protein
MADETYFVEIIRTTLDDFCNRVENEEAGASQFIDNQISIDNGTARNLASFIVLGPGKTPAPPTFARLGELPNTKRAAWTGVVLIDGRNTAVQMYRESQ